MYQVLQNYRVREDMTTIDSTTEKNEHLKELYLFQGIVFNNPLKSPKPSKYFQSIDSTWVLPCDIYS